MAGLVEQITLPAWKVTGACWRVMRKDDDTVVNIVYSDKELITPYRVYVADDLSDLLTKWKNNNLNVPASDIHIRVDRSIDKHNLNAQVDAIDLAWLDQNFNNLVKLCKVLGIVRLALRLFVDFQITLVELADIYLYFLQERKARRQNLESTTDWLANNGHITNAQKNAFWANIDANL
jgi:hypothetical protein